MALIKVNSKWIRLEDLTEIELEKLGLQDIQLMESLKSIPIEIKNKPCRKRKIIKAA